MPVSTPGLKWVIAGAPILSAIFAAPAHVYKWQEERSMRYRRFGEIRSSGPHECDEEEPSMPKEAMLKPADGEEELSR